MAESKTKKTVENKTSKNVYQKLSEARNVIRTEKLKKSGNNSFSKYDYFTPEQVISLVNNACEQTGLLTMFSLEADDISLYGELRIINIDVPEEVIFSKMRTSKPSIKATNDTQQMGGCETYTKRYMLSSAFDIADNSMDFDNDKGKFGVAKKAEKIVSIPTPDKDPLIALQSDIDSCKTEDELIKIWKSNSSLHKNKAFTDAVTKKKAELS